MNKKEFLDGLRQSLEGEVSSSVIDQNISYYHDYISSTEDEEERIIEKLGDPRLLAKTIIESERAARQKGYYKGSDSSHSYYHNSQEEESKDQHTNSNSGSMFRLTWSQKISLIITIVIVLVVLVVIGKMIIGFLFAFGVPIILILLLMALFKKRS